LAADLAEHWSRLDGGIQNPRDLVIAAIRRHDDGWQRWDDAPCVTPQTGRPLDFTEQAIETSNEIWSASIDSLADLGPLAQLMAGEHFLTLRSGGEAAKSPAGQHFIQKYRPRCAEWRTAISTTQRLTIAQQNAAINQLAFFDALSLLLCCKTSPGPATLFTWQRTRLTVSPHELLSAEQSTETLTVEPWPFRSAEVQLSAYGHLVPVRRYSHDADLRAEMKWREPLVWNLQQAG
jgi:hypothetical protein